MPHEGRSGMRAVIMPALGMAQDSGVLVAWHKAPGEAVAEGDVLFEVETDKATMEVVAETAGFLSEVTAEAGAEVPVGQTIARLVADAAEVQSAGPAMEAAEPAAPEAADALPEGHEVIMPVLGMAQDSGILVRWLVEAGARLAEDDPLFEVETDKSVVEVPAGAAGYLAARLADAGDEVPTGEVIAILTPQPPDRLVTRGAAAGPAPTKVPDPAPAVEPAPLAAPPSAAPPSAAPVAAGADGRILASPKARRLALEEGLDLARLVAAGHPQPYHVRDLDTLRAMPDAAADSAAPAPVAAQARHLTAHLPQEGVSAFAEWAASAGQADAQALLAGLVGGGLQAAEPLVAVETPGLRRVFRLNGDRLGRVTEAEPDSVPHLIVRDLRASRLTSLHLGAETAPVLSLLAAPSGLDLVLECAADQVGAADAVTLLTDIAGCLEQPLRRLL